MNAPDQFSRVRPRRSALYMPASNERAIAKSRALACDVVILDLEDAVAPDAKEAARRQATQAVAEGGFGRREVVIRVNGLDTPWGEADFQAAAAVEPDGILAPKVSSAEDVARCAAFLRGKTKLWAMIETCAALTRLEAIGSASKACGAAVWVMGTNDLAKEMRCQLDVERRPFWAPLSLAVIAARANGLVVLDGVFNDIADAPGLAEQCAQGAAFGFDGKTLIHPAQVETANRAFSPTPDEVANARTIVQAFDTPENAGKGVIRLDGRMVERLHLEQARHLLAVAEAIDP